MICDRIKNMQEKLDELQAIPIIGPVIFSPVKAVVSIAGIINGLALGIFYGVATVINRMTDRSYFNFVYYGLKRDAEKGFSSAVEGVGNLLYSAVNICSIGIVGAFIERRKIDQLSFLGF